MATNKHTPTPELADPKTRERTETGKFRVIHGYRRTAIYGIWSKAKGRCENPSDAAYPRYGGRGIVMCERWRQSFAAFLADMGPRPIGGTLERKNNDGPYSPDNCVWGTRTDQANNRRSNRIICAKGKSQTAMQWSRETGISENLIRCRIDQLGWTPDEAVSRKPGV
ncbi:MAG TPA: hypothetical protein VFO46_02330 [Candidatus Sulfotelmatobacter sp.]|nr:hypothetical protein [Candidatus Sulfotelmatobacter sp.]